MTYFEKAAVEADGKLNELDGENAIEWVRGSKTATVNLTKGRMATRVKELAQAHPDEAEVVHESEKGTVVAHIPVSWVRITRYESKMSPEQREAAAERLRKARLKSARVSGRNPASGKEEERGKANG